MSRKVASQVQNRKLVAERRDLIIAAAIKVFRQKGFHVATTRDIADAVGIAQSNLYNYVRKKDDILYLVCTSLMKLYSDVMADVSLRFTDPHARLTESLRAVISVMCSHKDELMLIYNEVRSLRQRDRRLILLEGSRFIEQFEKLIEAYEAVYGPIEITNRRLAANLLSFVPAVVALRSWDLAARVDQAELEAGILRFALTGLGIPIHPQAAARNSGLSIVESKNESPHGRRSGDKLRSEKELG